MKYFIIAGEKSGDLHASNLISEIRTADPEAEIAGWGGDRMSEAGATILKDYRELAFMGFIEVIRNIRVILGFLKLVKVQIAEFAPDVIVLVDYAGFNLRVARWAKGEGYKIAYYIAPKAWAWNESRVYKLKKYVDKLLVIFPFELEFFSKFGISTAFVGNPLKDEIGKFRKNEHFRTENKLDERPVIALLPGSRKQEVEKMLSLMVALSTEYRDYQLVIAGVSNLGKGFYEQHLAGSDIKIVFDQTYDLLSVSRAAVVTSGTATLETALFAVPQVVVYKTSNVSYLIAKSLVKIKYISLVNLVSEKEVVKELIQGDYAIDRVKEELNKVAGDTKNRKAQLMEYALLSEKLGHEGASKMASAEIVNLILKK
ncbi:lipid-A-disaccharide synthase [Emticicia sp. CRIBPO]|uniref:lipid-A-disaccharide synthase n=1 Tax=Emticicia sp. CRIBPO TaxID=2683258 RepID=UPI001412264E|nr:lipid-A-disaccharide synthase [Emticicia sp. CRIBPO]NBA87823.1 lipid-A-disaccharide synthase [Emticicia sp. CRIBPO]